MIFLRTHGVSLTGNDDFFCKRREGVHSTTNPHAMSRSRTRDFSRAVARSLSRHRLSHAQHVHVAQVTMECCLRKTFVFTLGAAWHTVHLL